MKNNIKHIHMIAICGTAMGALAGMLIKKGYKITGSDEGIYPPMSDYLKNLGISIMQGFTPKNLDSNPDMIIVGNTVKKINPEAQEMVRRGIPYMHLPQAIRKFFLKDKHPIVIAGTHGKTTTTALTSWVFESAGKNPSFLVGGVAKNYNLNAKVSKGYSFIIEGDEYDSSYFDKVPKCWHYCPKTAAITSIEFDHGDIYRDIEHIKEAFYKFVSLIPEDGLLVACADFPHIFDSIKDARCKVITYGYNKKAQLKITNVELNERGAIFSLKQNGKINYSFNTPLWGKHNAANATAVVLIALHHGITPSQIQKGFDTFKGIKRRQEIIYNKNEIIIIDDFAHHPTKVRETVKAVRNRFPHRKIISIFEPRTNTTRRSFFQDLYSDSFKGSDEVIIAGVYRPDQLEKNNTLNPQKLVEDINKKSIKSCYIHDVKKIVEYVSEEINPSDVVLIMSNGGFGGIYSLLPQKIDQKFQEILL